MARHLVNFGALSRPFNAKCSVTKRMLEVHRSKISLRHTKTG
jgi:hypothetical protein